MSGLTFTKAHVKTMAGVLDLDHETVEDAALAALEAALDIIKARAKFTVVGQVKTKDASGDKVALGWYPTLTQATQDALKLTYSTQTHEEHLAWVLPIFNDTPNAYYVSRKKAKSADEIADKSFRERELARRVAWFEDNPGAQPPKEWGVSIPLESDLSECPLCDGMGKVVKD